MYKLKEPKIAVEENVVKTPTTEDENPTDPETKVETAEEDIPQEESPVEEFNVPEEINEKSVYEYDGKKYYIDNEKFLQKRFDDIVPTKHYTTNMCIYKCVRKGCCPYLVYLLLFDPATNTYILPNYAQEPIMSSTEIDETEEKIMESFKEHLFEIYPPNEYIPLDVENEEPTDIYDEDLFKGFFLEEQTSTITMVYDATRVNVPASDIQKYCWASPYEIFITDKIKDVPISSEVVSVFKSISQENRKDFHHLKTMEDNTIVKTPYILFMCLAKADDETTESNSSVFSLFNIFGANNENIVYENVVSPMSNEIEQIIYPRIQHPKIGNYTFFSMDPLNMSNSDQLQRFVVFVDIDGLNPLYVEEEENDKLLHLYDIDQTEQYSSISFMHNGSSGKIQLWCIKSSYYFSEMIEIQKTEEILGEPVNPPSHENSPAKESLPVEQQEQLPQEPPAEEQEQLPPAEEQEQLPQASPAEEQEQLSQEQLPPAEEQEQLPQEPPAEEQEQLPQEPPAEEQEQLPQEPPAEEQEQLPQEPPAEQSVQQEVLETREPSIQEDNPTEPSNKESSTTEPPSTPLEEKEAPKKIE